MKCFTICVHHQVEQHLMLKSENSLLKHLKVSNVCSTFFPNRVKKQLFLKKWFYDGKQPLPPSILQAVLQIAQANKSISTQFKRGKTKSYGLLWLGTTPELTINRVSSFKFS